MSARGDHSASTTRSGDVRPTLEEVFLEPPLYGTPPSAAGLSANGRWALVRWSPPTARIEPGDEAPDRVAEPVLRVIDLAAPAWTRRARRGEAEPGDAGRAGPSLLERLGLDGDAAGAPADDAEGSEASPREPGAWAWSHRGAQLALAVGADVYLWDAALDEVRHIVTRGTPTADTAPAEEGDGDADDPQDDEEDTDAPEPDAEPEVSSVRFAPDDSSLRIRLEDELYVVSLDAAMLAGRLPLAVTELPSPSSALDAPAHELLWSTDLSVVFGSDPTPTSPDEEAEEDAQEETDDDSVDTEESADEDDAEHTPTPSPEVWHIADARGVVLEGMRDAEWMESTSLSPDGRFVFGAEFDRETEPEATLVPDYLTERVTAPEGRRFLAEDGPSPFRLWMWETDGGTRRELLPPPETKEPESLETEASTSTADEGTPDDDEPASLESADRREGEWWLRTVGWAPQRTPDAPARFAFERRSWDYHEREIWCWNGGEATRVWTEHDDAWVGGPATYSRWSADGTRLLVGSESAAANAVPGQCQLFAVDPESGATIQLTRFGGELARFTPTGDGGVLMEARDANRARRSIWFLSAAMVAGPDDPEPTRFATPPGTSRSARAARDGSRIVFAYEDLLRPAELWTADRETARPLTNTTPDAFDAVDWILPERISLETDDGRTVFAHVYLPPGRTLDAPGPARASIVFVHGAGYLQNVTDSMTSYPLNMMFHSRLARLGYPVIDVDYRGSAGYGRDFRTDVQYHLGGKDLEDIHAIVDLLIERGVVDRERVGLYGGSYGGFMTLMALFTAPERWTVGAALRSVTDWRTYHPTYTQPRLGRPSTHAEAYERSSPIDFVASAEDPVLILHGMLDENVFAQDSIRLIEALIDQGSEFDAMLYPSQGHGFRDGPHWLDEYGRIERYLTKHLGPPLPGSIQ